MKCNLCNNKCDASCRANVETIEKLNALDPIERCEVLERVASYLDACASDIVEKWLLLTSVKLNPK